MTKIILFNAPPGAGKDTIATHVQTALSVPSNIVKFAAPLKTVAMHLYCGGDSKKFYEFDNNQEIKSKPHPQFLGSSCRQVQIDISEVYMKKVHGEKVFGHLLVADIERKEKQGIEVFLVSDSGFRPEAEVLVEEFGPQNVLLVRIHREGKTYQGDSRNYIELEDLGVKTIDLDNINNDINQTMDTLLKEINKFVGV